MKKTLGGERLGSGNKMTVDLHGFERSTFDLSYIWRSTMASGTLVPFINEIAKPGDTFDIRLNCDIKTHPTIGPLFGSYKVQLDVFLVPIRLYHSALHNNRTKVGMNMKQIKLPKHVLLGIHSGDDHQDLDNSQISPSCIMSYLGIRGTGIVDSTLLGSGMGRKFNAVPFLAYWDIYKQYYSNKMEEVGYVISGGPASFPRTVTAVQINTEPILEKPLESQVVISGGELIQAFYTGTPPDPSSIWIKFWDGSFYNLDQLRQGPVTTTGSYIQITYNYGEFGNRIAQSWSYTDISTWNKQPPRLVEFPLEDIDTMREKLLMSAWNAEFNVNNADLAPYKYVLETYTITGEGETPVAQRDQEGLGIKTYQSDLFNNWLNTEWIDGTGGINEITAIDTTSGSINVDTIILARKVYDMLNRIAVSGGSYNDWLEAVYDEEAFNRAESPVYMGGLIKELVFQEVVSNSATQADGGQPLGTLAGKGVMSGKHKGGNVVIKVTEPSVILGICSLTPRIDYSQGNKWHVNLDTLDDIHKPSLDQIGFQELICEQQAWWTTKWDKVASKWVQKSAGKQPAWINYMTNVNEVRGNFAIGSDEMFMVLNRRYSPQNVADGDLQIKDLTTYVDPSLFNHIFAQTSLDAQNFWTQISVDMTARRKQSSKIMPNL